VLLRQPAKNNVRQRARGVTIRRMKNLPCDAIKLIILDRQPFLPQNVVAPAVLIFNKDVYIIIDIFG